MVVEWTSVAGRDSLAAMHEATHGAEKGPANHAIVRGGLLVLVVVVHAGLFVALGPALLEVFPLDDAYTHQVYAEGLRYGDGLSYLPSTPAAGSTSPLHALVLTPIQLAPLPALVPLTHVLGILGWIALAFATRRLVRVLAASASNASRGPSDRSRRAGLDVGSVAALAVVLDPTLAAAALSGMEVILAALVLVLALVAWAEDRPRLAGVLFGLGILARPELTLVWLAASASTLRRDRRASLWVALPGAIAWAAWAAWNHHAAGTLLPTTFFAKHGPLSILDRWRDLPRAVAQTMGAWPMLATIPLVVLGGRALARDDAKDAKDAKDKDAKGAKDSKYAKDSKDSKDSKRADPERDARAATAARTAGLLVLVVLVLWPLGIAWAHDLRETWRLYWWRYALPAHPLVIVLSVIGASRLEEGRRRLALAAIAIALVAGAWSTARHVGESARNVLELNVAAARYLDEHAAASDWIASNDAGAVRRLTGRPVVDLLGLNDAEVLVDRAAVLQRRRPRWYVVFESWFPGLVASPRFEVVHRVRTESLAICGECDQSELVILRAR